ncbi:unnamed protein product [Cochlearia groenlandica]
MRIFLNGLLDVQHWAWTRSDVMPRQPEPLQDMYMEIKKMTKLVNEVKYLKKSMTTGASSANCSSSQNLQLVVREPEEGSSSRANPLRNHRRPQCHIRRPPPPESDNESPTFSSYGEDFDPSRFYYRGKS